MLPHRLSKRQSPTTVLLRTPITQMITVGGVVVAVEVVAFVMMPIIVVVAVTVTIVITTFSAYTGRVFLVDYNYLELRF